jgi:hypothetical protein
MKSKGYEEQTPFLYVNKVSRYTQVLLIRLLLMCLMNLDCTARLFDLFNDEESVTNEISEWPRLGTSSLWMLLLRRVIPIS